MSNSGRLKISEPVIKRMHVYKQDTKKKTEGGGVLLGRFIKKSKDIIVDKVTVPMVADKRTRYSYIRNEKMHQRLINHAWDKSGGTCHYIGEWHTHPENYPTPSRQDYKNWKRILKEGIFSSLYLYFVIVGIKETRIWEGNCRTKKIKQIK